MEETSFAYGPDCYQRDLEISPPAFYDYFWHSFITLQIKCSPQISKIKSSTKLVSR